MRKVMDRDVMRTVVNESGMTQIQLAEMMGYKDQSAISQLVNRKRCSLDKTVAALNRMGYSLVVQRSGVNQFEITTDWAVES